MEHRRDRGGRDGDAVTVVPEPGDAVFRDVLLGRQVGNRRRDGRSVRDRSRHRIGKLPPCRRSAFPAAAFVGSRLGDPQRLGIGQVEHLAGLMADRIRHRHRLAARRTNSRPVVDDGVGGLRPPQRRAGVPLLAAGLAARASSSSAAASSAHRWTVACRCWSCPTQAAVPAPPHAPADS